MPRHTWRTVYSSSHKRVLVKPRNRPRITAVPSHGCHIPSTADDYSWLWWIVLAIVAIFVGGVILEYLLNFWWIILITFLFVFVIANH